MAGFFTKEETKAEMPVVRRIGCGACGLNKKCSHPKMPPVGEGSKRILIISESPSASEDATGSPLEGTGNQCLRRVIRKLGIHMDTDCWHTYAVTCHPPKSRDLTTKEIDNCRPQLLKYIENSDCIFIRNGKEYGSSQSKNHLELKYKHAKRWIKTTEDFIRYIATKSSLSGRPYMVNCDGQEMPSSKWLKNELFRIRNQ